MADRDVLLWQLVARGAYEATEAAGGFRPNRCVLMTRLLLELAKTMPLLASYRVRAGNTTAIGCNAAWYAHVAAGASPDDPISSFPPGAWSVGVDARQPAAGPGAFPGHLVAIVDGRLLVDASAPQFSRPDRQMPIPGPVVCELPAGWAAGEVASVRNVDGAVMTYLDATGVGGGWQHAPDWRRPPGWLLRPTVEHIEAQLAVVREVQRGA